MTGALAKTWTLGWAGLALAAGCSGGEPHACDGGTPTCDSALVILLPDPRTDFRLYVTDELGMDVTMDCPVTDPATEQQGDYDLVCGGGRLSIGTFRSFGDTVDVQLEEGQPKTYTPDYSRGGDYCGNPCTSGTIQL